MLEARSEREWVVRLQDGEDLVASLKQLQGESALVLIGIGMVRDLAWGFWNGECYDIQCVDDACEVLSLQGNLARDESGDMVVHAHITVAGRDGIARGGHLVRATVHNTLELGLKSLQAVTLNRRLEASGLVGLFPDLREDRP